MHVPPLTQGSEVHSLISGEVKRKKILTMYKYVILVTTELHMPLYVFYLFMVYVIVIIISSILDAHHTLGLVVTFFADESREAISTETGVGT